MTDGKNMKHFHLMTAFAVVAVVVASCAARMAHAQPVSQTYSVPMCPTGGGDANGNPYVAPCGYTGFPIAVVVSSPIPAPVTTPCPPNPISKKIPPLC